MGRPEIFCMCADWAAKNFPVKYCFLPSLQSLIMTSPLVSLSLKRQTYLVCIFPDFCSPQFPTNRLKSVLPETCMVLYLELASDLLQVLHLPPSHPMCSGYFHFVLARLALKKTTGFEVPRVRKGKCWIGLVSNKVD